MHLVSCCARVSSGMLLAMWGHPVLLQGVSTLALAQWSQAGLCATTQGTRGDPGHGSPPAEASTSVVWSH